MYRERTKISGALTGHITRSHASDGVHIDTTVFNSDPLNRDYCFDDTGPQQLRTRYFKTESAKLPPNGFTYSYVNPEGVRSECVNYLPPSMRGIDDIQHIFPTVLDEPGSGGGYAVELLKRTNPSRPSVSLPTFLGESMEDVKKLPETVAEKGANYGTTLGVRFGLLPFVSDVLKMTRLSESVDKRSAELVRLNNKGGARVRRVLEDFTATSVASADFVAGRDPEQSGRVETTTRSRTWGEARWIPDSSFQTVISGGKANRAEIRRILLGIGTNKNLSGYGKDAWNLIPFSWLTDWFTNFGDLLAANQNDNLSHPENVCIMRHMITTRTYIGPQGRSIRTLETKMRSYPTYLQLTWSNPLLSADQMLILSGLAHRNPRYGKPYAHSGGNSTPPGD
jgi:hypothetical protein